MYLCSDGHDEICYDQRNCPMCELLWKNCELVDLVFELKEENEGLKKEAIN